LISGSFLQSQVELRKHRAGRFSISILLVPIFWELRAAQNCIANADGSQPTVVEERETFRPGGLFVGH
jgi:hypothetical protein